MKAIKVVEKKEDDNSDGQHQIGVSKDEDRKEEVPVPMIAVSRSRTKDSTLIDEVEWYDPRLSRRERSKLILKAYAGVKLRRKEDGIIATD